MVWLMGCIMPGWLPGNDESLERDAELIPLKSVAIEPPVVELRTPQRSPGQTDRLFRR